MQRCSVGKIPDGPLAGAGLRNLTSLSLHACGVRDVSELLRDPSLLPALQRLSLCANRIRLLSNNIASFTTLKELSLRCNLLQDLPIQITRLSALTRLDLSFNPLGGLPSIVSSSPQLQGRQLAELFAFLAGLSGKGALASPGLCLLLFAPSAVDAARFVNEMKPGSGTTMRKQGRPGLGAAIGSAGRRGGIRLANNSPASAGSLSASPGPSLSPGGSASRIDTAFSSLLDVETIK